MTKKKTIAAKLHYKDIQGKMIYHCPFIEGVKVNSYTCTQCKHHLADNERKEYILCKNDGIKIKQTVDI